MPNDIIQLAKRKKADFAQNVKILCIKHNEELASHFDFNNDDLFLHPALVAYLNHPRMDHSMTFEQVTRMLVSPAERRSTFKATADKTGMIYLPNIGNVATNVPFGMFELSELQADTVKVTLSEGEKITMPVIPINKLADSNLEVLQSLPANLSRDFKSYYRGKIVDAHPEYSNQGEKAIQNMELALQLLRTHAPKIAELIASTNSCVFVHDNPSVINYVARSTQGCMYLYNLDESTPIYYLEEFCHQGGHNLLNLIAAKRSDLFKVDVENMLIGQYINRPDDYRTIFSVMHGLASIGYRVICFENILSSGTLSGQAEHELRGRYADQLKRFDGLGLELLNLDNVLTPLAQDIFMPLYEKTKQLLDTRREEFRIYDLEWRDVDFRYSTFLEHNPISVAHTSVL